MQCLLMWCPLTDSLQKSFMLWVSVNWRLQSQFYLHHCHSLCIRCIHHTGKHMPLFLSNHDLQSLMVSPDSWSIFISIWTYPFCPFSILGMAAKCVGICRLQHAHSPPALPVARYRAGVGLPAVSARARHVVESSRTTYFRSASMIMQMMHVPYLLAKTASHHCPAPQKYMSLFLKTHANGLRCHYPFFSSSVSWYNILFILEPFGHPQVHL